MELKQSGVYLHDSDLLLQVSRYDCNTGQGHEMLTVQLQERQSWDCTAASP